MPPSLYLGPGLILLRETAVFTGLPRSNLFFNILILRRLPATGLYAGYKPSFLITYIEKTLINMISRLYFGHIKFLFQIRTKSAEKLFTLFLAADSSL